MEEKEPLTQSFEELNLDPAILRGIQDLGYQRPMDVQLACLEPLRAGQSLSVRSRTGTGKTAAFGIPLLERLEVDRRQLQVLVLTPTRELAAQVARELAALGRHRDVQVLGAWGGAPLGEQIRALRDGGHVLVGTPGRLLDLERRRALRFDTVTAAVLDEADEMLSMGFFEDVTHILDGCEACNQMVILSASLSTGTEQLIAKYAPDVVRIDLSVDSLSVDRIENFYYEIGTELPKHHYLLHVLAVEQPTSAIIFANTRTETSLVATLLAREGYKAEMISGELPQSERERVMAAIRTGELRFLVATDLAARGIDISHLTHVVNYSLPEDPALYLHRVGRTGRVDRKGRAVSLVGGRDSRTLTLIQRTFGVPFVRREFPKPADIVKERTSMQIESLIQSASAAICDGFLDQARAILSHPESEQIVAYLLKRHASQVHDEQRAAANRPPPRPQGGRPSHGPRRSGRGGRRGRK